MCLLKARDGARAHAMDSYLFLFPPPNIYVLSTSNHATNSHHIISLLLLAIMGESASHIPNIKIIFSVSKHGLSSWEMCSVLSDLSKSRSCIN